jgi:hypothetical protein
VDTCLTCCESFFRCSVPTIAFPNLTLRRTQYKL